MNWDVISDVKNFHFFKIIDTELSPLTSSTETFFFFLQDVDNWEIYLFSNFWGVGK